jgi:hypothetical protein
MMMSRSDDDGGALVAATIRAAVALRTVAAFRLL